MMRKYVLLAWVFLIPLVCSAQPSQMKKVAKDYAKILTKAKYSTVAVLVFRYPDGRISSGSSMLSEQLGADLGSMKGIRVADRAFVRKKIREQNIAESMVLDETLIKKIGRAVEVETLILGSLSDNPNGQTDVLTQIIHVETGKELGSAKSVVKRTWRDPPQFPRRP